MSFLRIALIIGTAAIASLIPTSHTSWASEGIVAGLSQNNVPITARFNGSEILVYGAITRNTPAPEGPPLNVIVTVEGPSFPVTVRKKEKQVGIWMNGDTVRINKAPSFYAVATTAPIAEALSDTDDLRHKITVPRAIRAIGTSEQSENAPDFIEALIRVRESENYYRLSENSIEFTENTLFRADIILPANLIEGNYSARIFITRGGQVIDYIEQDIMVSKEGLERFLYDLSRDQPLIYGLLSLLIAVSAGWGASSLFRLMRR